MPGTFLSEGGTAAEPEPQRQSQAESRLSVGLPKSKSPFVSGPQIIYLRSEELAQKCFPKSVSKIVDRQRHISRKSGGCSPCPDILGSIVHQILSWVFYLEHYAKGYEKVFSRKIMFYVESINFI